MFKDSKEIIRNIPVALGKIEELKTTLPKGIDEEKYISYINSLLNFVELNFLTIDGARLNYHLCSFGDVQSPYPPKANDQYNGILKYGMYDDHHIASGKFVNKYKMHYVPHGISQETQFGKNIVELCRSIIVEKVKKVVKCFISKFIIK